MTQRDYENLHKESVKGTYLLIVMTIIACVVIGFCVI